MITLSEKIGHYDAPVAQEVEFDLSQCVLTGSGSSGQTDDYDIEDFEW